MLPSLSTAFSWTSSPSSNSELKKSAEKASDAAHSPDGIEQSAFFPSSGSLYSLQEDGSSSPFARYVCNVNKKKKKKLVAAAREREKKVIA